MAWPHPGCAQQPGAEPHDTTLATLHIPQSLRFEHEELHAELVRATKVPGEVGVAARAVAELLEPHFVREEQIALPPLGLLAPLSQGKPVGDRAQVLAMTDSLRTELPRMLGEHLAIRTATLRLQRVARRSGNAGAVQLAGRLLQHAKSEEEIFYPAAVLVGDILKSRK